MRFATSSTNDQRSLVRVAPRVFLIRDGKLLDRRRQGEQRQRSTRQAFQLGPLKLRANGLEPAGQARADRPGSQPRVAIPKATEQRSGRCGIP